MLSGGSGLEICEGTKEQDGIEEDEEVEKSCRVCMGINRISASASPMNEEKISHTVYAQRNRLS